MSEYIERPNYAADADRYVRGFLLLQKDLINLFDYVEPDQRNEPAYRFRIFELLNRVCMEVETNLTAILIENGYPPSRHLTMTDYKKVERSHLLSAYEVQIPYWKGTNSIRVPFSPWATANGSLPWYQAYNAAKHDRHNNFDQASFGHLTNAICGLVAVVSAQFHQKDFAPGADVLFAGRARPFEEAVGQYFGVKWPTWPAYKRYNFTLAQMQTWMQMPSPFQNFLY